MNNGHMYVQRLHTDRQHGVRAPHPNGGDADLHPVDREAHDPAQCHDILIRPGAVAEEAEPLHHPHAHRDHCPLLCLPHRRGHRQHLRDGSLH